MKFKKLLAATLCATSLITGFSATAVPVNACSTNSSCNGAGLYILCDKHNQFKEVVGHYLYPDGVTYRIYLSDGCYYCKYSDGGTSWGVWTQNVNTLPHDTIPGYEDSFAINAPNPTKITKTVNGNKQLYYRGIYGTTLIKFGNVTKTAYYNFNSYLTNNFDLNTKLGYSKSITYSWSCSDSSVSIKNANSANAKVAFTKKGTYTLKCKSKITWKDGSTSTYTDSITVNVK